MRDLFIPKTSRPPENTPDVYEILVKAHLDSVYNKLGVDSRAAAVATAIERGLLTKQN